MQTISKVPRRYVILLYISLGIHAAFCISLHYNFLNPLFYITTHCKGQAGPFFGIYQAGVNLNNGESIYATESYNPTQHLSVPYYHFYRYLPFCSYVSSVVTRVLKPWPAYWTWVVINELILALCIILTLRLRAIYGSAAYVAASMWLLFSPLYIELFMGQFCFTMTFFIFLIIYPYLKSNVNAAVCNPAGSRRDGSDPATVAPRADSLDCNPGIAATIIGAPGEPAGTESSPRTRDTIAKREDARTVPLVTAIPWTFSILLKSFTALYSLTLIRLGKKRIVLAGIAAAVLTSVPYYLRHPHDLKWFLLLNLRPIPGEVTGGCFGFNGLMKSTVNHIIPPSGIGKIQLGLFDISTHNVPLVLVLFSIVLVSFLITVIKKRIDPLGNIALWTLTFFLVFKDIWEYHYVMLIPLFVGFYLETRSRYVLVLFALLALPTPFILYDVPSSENPHVYWSTPLSLMHHSLKAVPTLLFYLWVVKRELRDMKEIRPIPSLRRLANQRIKT